jgi:hypothetical protein
MNQLPLLQAKTLSANGGHHGGFDRGAGRARNDLFRRELTFAVVQRNGVSWSTADGSEGRVVRRSRHLFPAFEWRVPNE